MQFGGTVIQLLTLHPTLPKGSGFPNAEGEFQEGTVEQSAGLTHPNDPPPLPPRQWHPLFMRPAENPGQE